MSVEIMGKVWGMALPHQHKMVLLSMADHADHEGKRVYPSLGLLSWKTDYSVRQIRRVIGELVAMKILVKRQALPGRPAHYDIHLCNAPMKAPFRQKLEKNLGHHDLGESDENIRESLQINDIDNNLGHSDLGNSDPGHGVLGHGDTDPGHGVLPTPDMVSPKPNTKPSVIQPSKDSLSSASSDEERETPVPKVQELVDAYNLICAGHGRLPKKQLISEKVKTDIRRRLKEHPQPEFWETVLNKCVDNLFLSGRVSSFRATLDWLVKNGENAIKVYEGNYDER